jgi:hypothetical protein
MTTRISRAVVEGLTKLDIQPSKRTGRGAQMEGRDGVCAEGKEGGGERVAAGTATDLSETLLTSSLTPAIFHI